jgi:PadR family transcriptional regulator, regulatory protein PadR
MRRVRRNIINTNSGKALVLGCVLLYRIEAEWFDLLLAIGRCSDATWFSGFENPIWTRASAMPPGKHHLLARGFMNSFVCIGVLEQIILLTVLRLEDHAFGAAIRAEIERHTGRHVSKSGFYLTLDRMKAKGLVEFRLGQPTPKAGGRAKRYYSLTAEGLEAARYIQLTFQSLLNGLEVPIPLYNLSVGVASAQTKEEHLNVTGSAGAEIAR